MASYIPTKDQGIRVLVAMLIIFALARFLPIPENLRQMLRVLVPPGRVLAEQTPLRRKRKMKLHKRYLGCINWPGANQVTTFALPRNYALVALEFELVADLTRAATAADGGGPCDSAPAQLVRNMDVIVNGSDTIKHTDFETLHRKNQIQFGTRPRIYSEDCLTIELCHAQGGRPGRYITGHVGAVVAGPRCYVGRWPRHDERHLAGIGRLG